MSLKRSEIALDTATKQQRELHCGDHELPCFLVQSHWNVVYMYISIGMLYVCHRLPEGCSYCTDTEQKYNSFTSSSKGMSCYAS